ncbi:glycosyltransferase family 39 protein [Synechococcus sp. CS-1324]|uniref:ArnT family glycosyltransferase n=1 Tax=unclassified Synechococcus TaxID=2626047 RepID=UPI0021A39CCF|nr:MULTISPECIES: glycosyltransferase family 39 protein [unclassified Synechococcus]MCT0212164.1 glycosyltransferase family 39 protein [Synechococcus sp. CS-1326]MCT0230429.1 glycosyltransferase family 39 protein [Synechococcus sp. CS-1324]MCT0233361.1 glycosyltransferase family 39 protein [Synechococcus sp. CS-1327]
MPAADPAPPGRGAAGLPLWLPLLTGLALRLVQIQAPILGVHSWRQADTAAMARNFAEQGMHVLLPQIDWAGAGSGVVEAEFPLYPYAVALLYRLFGVREWLARGVSVALSVLTIWLLIRIGRRLVGARAGWWGGMAAAVLPIPVFYGRTVQPEATLLFLAALCLEGFLAWLERDDPLPLLLSWLAFTAACLIKVLPFLWLGVPLLWLWGSRRSWRVLRQPGTWLFPLAAAAVTALWYWHAHRLGQASGLSFGFWGGEANRYSWRDLLGPGYWLGLAIRITVRNLAVLGLPLLVLGLLGLGRIPDREQRTQALVLPIGLGAVLAAGALAPESSAVHEYYQLPLTLFAAPLIGLGWVRLQQGALPWLRGRGWILLILLPLVSLTVLTIDYWSRENTAGSPTLALAERIRKATPPEARVVVASGSDPTVLYLAHRKGWLVSPAGLIKRSPEEWRQRGAAALAGSFQQIESFRPFENGPAKTRLRSWVCAHAGDCGADSSFLIPLGPIEPARR